ncbi:hypothetical protein AO375_0989 [Moraxella catarrhalis]|nr:hypothetical protein AO380_1386 [Moraxella catarrhalis]OAV14778.1 hypothetical protein AO375_0989 [Moraxella catarrhalis]
MKAIHGQRQFHVAIGLSDCKKSLCHSCGVVVCANPTQTQQVPNQIVV